MTRAWILILPKNNNSGKCPLTNANLKDSSQWFTNSTSELLGIAYLEDKFSVVYFSTSETTWDCLLRG